MGAARCGAVRGVLRGRSRAGRRTGNAEFPGPAACAAGPTGPARKVTGPRRGWGRSSGPARGRTAARTPVRRGTGAGGEEPRGEVLDRGHGSEPVSEPAAGQPPPPAVPDPLPGAPGTPPAPATTWPFPPRTRSGHHPPGGRNAWPDFTVPQRDRHAPPLHGPGRAGLSLGSARLRSLRVAMAVAGRIPGPCPRGSPGRSACRTAASATAAALGDDRGHSPRQTPGLRGIQPRVRPDPVRSPAPPHHRHDRGAAATADHGPGETAHRRPRGWTRGADNAQGSATAATRGDDRGRSPRQTPGLRGIQPRVRPDPVRPPAPPHHRHDGGAAPYPRLRRSLHAQGDRGAAPPRTRGPARPCQPGHGRGRAVLRAPPRPATPPAQPPAGVRHDRGCRRTPEETP